MECNLIPAPVQWDDATPEMLQKYRLHIGFCRSCRELVLREAPDQLLFSLDDDALPDDFWIGFWDSTRKKMVTGATGAPLPFQVARWTAAIALAVLITFFGSNISDAPFPVKIQDFPQYPVIEDLQSPEARYYILQSDQKEKIVMLFDPGMDL